MQQSFPLQTGRRKSKFFPPSILLKNSRKKSEAAAGLAARARASIISELAINERRNMAPVLSLHQGNVWQNVDPRHCEPSFVYARNQMAAQRGDMYDRKTNAKMATGCLVARFKFKERKKCTRYVIYVYQFCDYSLFLGMESPCI
jgi:hypothetical protein